MRCLFSQIRLKRDGSLAKHVDRDKTGPCRNLSGPGWIEILNRIARLFFKVVFDKIIKGPRVGALDVISDFLDQKFFYGRLTVHLQAKCEQPLQADILSVAIGNHSHDSLKNALKRPTPLFDGNDFI
jgi:hypothetical protein